MPVIALAPVAIAAAGIAAEGLTAFTAAAAVGAAVSAVGSFTGNKTLAIAGGVLGAVGGIGAIADSAGVFGEGGLFGGGSTAGAGGASEMGAQVAATQAGSYPDVGSLMEAQGIGSNTDVLSTIAGATPPANVLQAAPTNSAGDVIPQGGDNDGFVAPGISSQPKSYIPGNDGNGPAGARPGSVLNQTSATAGVAPQAPAPPSASAVPGSADAANPYGTTTGQPAVSGPYSATLPAGAASATVTGQGPAATVAAVDQPGAWTSISKWIEGHPALALAGVSAASSFLSGAFSPKTPAEVNALNAQAAKNTADVGLVGAQTGLINQQVTNMQQLVPGATRTRTNTGTRGMNGLINSVSA